MKVQSKFVSKLSFITLTFACQDCEVFIGTSYTAQKGQNIKNIDDKLSFSTEMQMAPTSALV